MDMSNPVQLHARTPITWLAVEPHMNDKRKQRINLIKQTKKKKLARRYARGRFRDPSEPRTLLLIDSS